MVFKSSCWLVYIILSVLLEVVIVIIKAGIKRRNSSFIHLSKYFKIAILGIFRREMTKKMKTKRSEDDIEIRMKNTKMRRRDIERKTEIETGRFKTVGDGQRHYPIFFM